MLPSNGFPFEQYSSVILNAQHNWDKYVHRVPAAVKALPHLVGSPLMREAAKGYGLTKDEEITEAVKLALVLLNKALGSEAVSILFRYQELETIIAVLPFAVDTRANANNSALQATDLQVAMLCAIVVQLCLECGGRDPMGMLYSLLDQIALPYYQHRILIDKVVSHLGDYRPTIN